MADTFSQEPDESYEEFIKRLAESLERAGLGDVKLSDLIDAAIANALSLCDGDRDRAAAALGVTREHLDFKLDAPRDGAAE